MNHMADSELDTKPWYQQFWPWVLIILPASAVFGGIATIIIAFQTKDSVVVDNYYKEGLAINRDLARDQVAEKMGIHATLRIDSAEHSLTLKLQASQVIADKELQLSLLHPTLSNRDQSLLLRSMGNGQYRGFLRAPETGEWNLILEPKNKKWRIAQRLHLQSNQELLLR